MTLAVVTPTGNLAVMRNDGTVIVPHTGARGHSCGAAIFEVASGAIGSYVNYKRADGLVWKRPGGHLLVLGLRQ